jgi:hypothetical protein
MLVGKSIYYKFMKYLIRESQFKKVVFRYLDSLNLTMDENMSAYVFYGANPNEEADSGRVIVLFKVDMGCYINSDFAQDICDVFSLTPGESLDVIGKWIENKLGIIINDVYSDFNAD